jgi:hypothetical protein
VAAFPTMTLTQNKQNVIVGVLCCCRVPPWAIKAKVFRVEDRMCERSALNQQLRIHCIPVGCTGAWASYLRNTEEVCGGTARNVENHFCDPPGPSSPPGVTGPMSGELKRK